MTIGLGAVLTAAARAPAPDRKQDQWARCYHAAHRQNEEGVSEPCRAPRADD